MPIHIVETGTVYIKINLNSATVLLKDTALHVSTTYLLYDLQTRIEFLFRNDGSPTYILNISLHESYAAYRVFNTAFFVNKKIMTLITARLPAEFLNRISTSIRKRREGERRTD